MKSFKQFLNEETMPYATNARGIIDIENSSVRDGLNSQIAGVTAGKFVTPYIALERVSKALANYHISIPRHSFLEGDSGMFVWPINQFGIKFGQNIDGTFVQDGEVLKDTSKGIHPEGEDNKVVSEPNRDVSKPFSVFFEYRQSDCGMFNVFCEVVSQDELDEILADLEAELNDEGEEEEDEEELNEEAVDEACWKGYRKEGMKKMFGKMYPNCVKVDEEQLNELDVETLKSYKEKQLFSKDKSPLQSYNRLVGRARANRKIKAKEDIKEQIDEGYNDPVHRKHISEVVSKFVPKNDPRHDIIVDHLYNAKNFGSKTKDELETKAGISLGSAHAITKAVSDHMKTNFGTPNRTQTQGERIQAHLKDKQIRRK